MELDDDHRIVLRWASNSDIEYYGEPDDLVYETSGDIIVVDSSDKKKGLVGKFRLYYIDVGRAMNEDEEVYHVLDAHSEHLAEYFKPIFDSEDPNFSEQLLDLYSHEIYESNFLVIDRLEILPQFRGERLGLKILRHLIDRFSPSAGIVAIKPYPLQFEHEPLDKKKIDWKRKLELSQCSTDQKASTERLHQYYSELGFQILKNSKMMVLSTGHTLPSI